MGTDGESVDSGVLECMKHNRSLSGLNFDDERCVQLLEGIFASNSGTHFTIIIDALDECEDYDMLLQFLLSTTKTTRNVRLAFSSRFQVQVDAIFTNVVTVTITSQNKEDIKEFLNIEIPKRRVGSGMTDGQADRLKTVLMARASGMFVLASI